MKLKELFANCEAEIPQDVAFEEITSLRINADECMAGSLFIALKGGSHDGADFAMDAVARGAVAVLCERKIEGVKTVVVGNARKTMAKIAAEFYGNPAKNLKLIAVVGTNGKTTTSTLIARSLEKLGRKTVNIGTLGVNFNGRDEETGFTTPDPIELHRILGEAADNGAEYAVMEVSAHAIYYKKIYGLTFEIAVFTNLTQDHLDFFGTMENYAAVKKSFFTDGYAKLSIVNVDDPTGREIARDSKFTTFTYGLENPADVFAIDVRTTGELEYTANVMDAVCRIKTRLHGKFNAYNTLAALATVVLLGCDIRTAAELINSAEEVKGRYNVIKGAKTVIIDYAHTPDGLKNVLRTARESCRGRVISVFGCGGNRDASKRRIMGEISGAIADFTVVTTDNSRFEDPYSIMEEIAAGVESCGGMLQKIRDREDAIRYAVDYASCRDVIVVAGKGAEDYIDERGEKRSYSDYESVKRALGRN